MNVTNEGARGVLCVLCVVGLFSAIGGPRMYTTSESHLRVRYKPFEKKVLYTNHCCLIRETHDPSQHSVTWFTISVLSKTRMLHTSEAHGSQREHPTGRKVKHGQLDGPHLPECVQEASLSPHKAQLSAVEGNCQCF
jgi:hypothetical protein